MTRAPNHLLQRLISPVLALLFCAMLWPAAVHAADTTAASEIAKLSDKEVRERYIEQTAQAEKRRGTNRSFNPAVIVNGLQHTAGTIGRRLREMLAATSELPDIAPRAWQKFSAGWKPGALWRFFLAMGLALVGAGGVALFARNRFAAPLQPSGATNLIEKATAFASLVMRDSVFLVIFALVATAIFVVGFDLGAKGRLAFFFYLAATTIFAAAVAISNAYFRPYQPKLRLPSFTDADARSLHRGALITVGFAAFAFFTCALFAHIGVNGPVHDLFLLLIGTITIVLLAITLIVNRKAISRDLAAAAPSTSLRARLAESWPWAQAAIVVVMWVGLVVDQLVSDFVPYGAALFTIAVLFFVPSLDAALHREERAEQEEETSLHSVKIRSGRLALTIATIASLVIAWRINPLAAENKEAILVKLGSAAFEIMITLSVAYVLWQIASVWIERKIAEEDAELAAQGIALAEGEIGGAGLSRTRTLLPLALRAVQITLGMAAVLIVLSALGVNIAPLLAGAGVVGLAIGFGSQTLVRDIVSGAFFLIDDALRIGEYIDTSSVKGVVERMSIRSVQLRHHRGAVHTVPFGEIKTLTNYSRDWAIMKHRFTVPFTTDLEVVRKLLKKVGAELAENPAIKDDFIQPFKSQGAVEIGDYGFIISTKFMSKPGKQFVIRRFAFAAVQKAFKENGIEFALPKIDVGSGDDAKEQQAMNEKVTPESAASQSTHDDQKIAAAARTVLTNQQAAAARAKEKPVLSE